MCPVALVLSLFYWSLVRSNFIRAHDAVIITFYRFSRGSSVGQCTRALPRIFLCRTGPINRRKYLHGDHHRWPHQRNCRIRFNGESTFTELCPLNKIQNHRKNHGVWKSQKKISFNIASEASYVYILSGQKLIKKAKNRPFGRVFENPKLNPIFIYFFAKSNFSLVSKYFCTPLIFQRRESFCKDLQRKKWKFGPNFSPSISKMVTLL